MKIILLGAPGSGKGTQSQKIIKKFNFDIIATGDIFRKEISNKTKIGLEAKALIKNGQLIPDAITNELVKNTLLKRSLDNKNSGILLDGYPRTISQAQTLDKTLAENSSQIDAVIYLKANEKTVIERIVNRRICSECGSVYNMLHSLPAKPGRCDNCNGLLIYRSDDTLPSIKKRLISYYKNTEPLVEYYETRHKLYTIDANQLAEVGFVEIQKIITQISAKKDK